MQGASRVAMIAGGGIAGLLVTAFVGVASLATAAPVPGAETFVAQGAVSREAAADVAASLFDRAMESRDGGEFEAALRELDELVRRFPIARYPDLEIRAGARTRAGQIHLARGEAGFAARRFLEVLDLEPESSWSDRSRLGLARVFLWLGHPTAAARELQEIVDGSRRGGGRSPGTGMAAAGFDGGADPGDEPVDRARRLLTLIHRLEIRPRAGESPWTRSGALQLPEQRLDDPIAVSAGAGGRVLIVDEGVDLVAIYDLDGGSVARLPNQEVRRPWWGIDGTAYLPTEDDGVFPLGMPRVDFVQERDGRRRRLDDLWAGARDALGRWILLDRDPRRVVRFDAAGRYLDTLWEGDGREPVDLAVDGRGRVYVLDRELDNVVRFSPDGSNEGTVASGDWDRPESVAVDALGNVYVLDRDAEAVEVFDRQGNRRFRLGPNLPGGIRLRDPRDLDVDDSGRLLIADRDLSSIIVLE